MCCLVMKVNYCNYIHYTHVLATFVQDVIVIDYRKEALSKMEETMASSNDHWKRYANESYIKEAGWYFKTLAVQEIGENMFLTIQAYDQCDQIWQTH